MHMARISVIYSIFFISQFSLIVLNINMHNIAHCFADEKNGGSHSKHALIKVMILKEI